MENRNIEEIEAVGDQHIPSSVETPLRKNAFLLSDSDKIEEIQFHFSKIMKILGLDLSDDSLSGTPYRVAKMYVKELFYGLNPKARPRVSTFSNKYGYKKLLIEQNITLNSTCEHHFLPITGKVYVGYIPDEKIVGLSKINRLVDYYAHRPQVQERLCAQILSDLQNTLETDDVIVLVNAYHLCVSSRGIKDNSSFTTSLEYGGLFQDMDKRSEFMNMLDLSNKG